MKGAPVEQLVHAHIFPNQSPRDPPNFAAFAKRHLVPEVRREVLAFYGHLDTDEARYPGLDYNSPIHRVRLTRWRHHRDLFRAFDALRLTPLEISSVTCWEGTKWARDNHEHMRHEPIRDTSADHMPHWAYLAPRPVSRSTGRIVPPRTLRPRRDRMTGIAKDAEHEVSRSGRSAAAATTTTTTTTYIDEDQDEDHVMDDDDDDEDDYATEDDDNEDEEREQDTDEEVDEEEDEEMISVGEALNERLRAQAARRHAGDTNIVMDPEWEAWLAWFKSSVDRGDTPPSPAYMTAAVRALVTPPTPTTPAPASPSRAVPRSLSSQQHPPPRSLHHDQIPPAMIAAGRAGRWHDVPGRYQFLVHQALLQQQQQQHLRHWPADMPPPDEIVCVPERR